MTRTSRCSEKAPTAAPADGRRVIKVSGSTIATARAQVAISQTLGRPVSDTVRKIAAVR